jgi:hypothetical protein
MMDSRKQRGQAPFPTSIVISAQHGIHEQVQR